MLAVLFLGLFHEWFAGVNSKIFGVSKAEARAAVFSAFQQYRFAIVVLSVVPYVALKIIA